MSQVTLVGRSSSHYTRVARIFAHELEIAHAFRPVLDLTTLDTACYGDNPALKIPTLIDERGALFGAENICHALVRRSQKDGVVMRGALDDRLVTNAEELVLHIMSAEVTLVMAKFTGHAAPPKVVRSIENSLSWLDERIAAIVGALPAERSLSFVETSLFCVLTHLPWREVMDVSSWKRLDDFRRRFEERESARTTAYRFDQA